MVYGPHLQLLITTIHNQLFSRMGTRGTLLNVTPLILLRTCLDSYSERSLRFLHIIKYL